MCTVCGCSGDGATISDATGGHAHAHPHEHGEGHAPGEGHVHTHADGTTHSHGHGHGHSHAHGHEHDHGHGHAHHPHDDHDHHPAGGTLDYGTGPARAHAPGLSQARMVEIETSILAKNDDYAARNRAGFEAAGLLALNLLSGPGAGKTTLLVETLKALAGRLPTAVIEGDQQTDNDAARIRAAGAPAVQINTGKGCHLDAHMVGHAVEKLPLPPGGVLFIENVGNLVCPAAFDLGETKRVTLISVAEGDDKPLKYPDIFEGADLVLITKADLAPYVDADMAQLEANIRRVNPRAEILRVSARGEVGLTRWLAWLDKARAERLDALAAAREREAQALRAAMTAAVSGGAR
ncbi:hydrogenase nickel incorporation protein HypB [Xanthobacter oligotrophicus]|uniref:hydrogenase nickel incorporation protein HypB n=1 Tax=Xanthobacter oligotrophicus TaxID=2607286 RepID=UPI0011F0D035|nr:hydrogenase nickel incorporation protein HypB [Xanthobacter oligotrophicus]MCG5234790.1 hydrogenase nickel incorporation protein HypB [Xanthobacter oligotrophicus]